MSKYFSNYNKFSLSLMKSSHWLFLCLTLINIYNWTTLQFETASEVPSLFGTQNAALPPFSCKPLHYWLRHIEGVQFRFDNFGSHFIRVQIFQIDFSTLLLISSASKYFRLILEGPNEHVSISFSHYHAIETVVHQLRKDREAS